MEVLEEPKIVGSIVILRKDEKTNYEDIIKMVSKVPIAEYGPKVVSIMGNDRGEMLLQLSGREERVTEFVARVQDKVVDVAKAYLYNSHKNDAVWG